MKKMCVFLLSVCLMCSMIVVPAFAATADFMDTFSSVPTANATNGWSFGTQNVDAGTITCESYIMDNEKTALNFKAIGAAGKTLNFFRKFPARSGNFVIDLEIAFKSKGGANFINAWQGSQRLFTMVADGENFSGYVGNGGYADGAVSTIYMEGYAINTAYHIQIAINSTTNTFNVYVNNKIVKANIPLRNKIVNGMDKIEMTMASNSTAEWQLLNFGIQTPTGSPSVSNVTIDKTPYLGNTISADYTFAGNKEDDFSTVKWMYSDSENGTYKYITGATEKSFTVTPYVAGKWIKAEVTPCNGLFASGTPVYSSPVLDMTTKTVGIDENTVYDTKNNVNSVWDKESETLTLKPTGTTAAVATVGAKDVTGTVVFEASIKNKTKSASNLIYVYKGSSYVFNITFNASHIVLATGTSAGSGYKTENLVASYAADTWYDIKAILNTTSNTADFYVNGDLVFEGRYLRSDLSTSGITSMTLTGTTASDGETYLKGLKLYKVSAPELTATSASIQDTVVYTDKGVGSVTLKADLLDQFGNKMSDNGFDWALTEAINGVSLTTAGVLSVNNADVTKVTVKAVSKDNESITAEKEISILKNYEITNFAISASDGQPITTLDRNLTATANADVLIHSGSKNVTLILAFYDASGALRYIDFEYITPDYNVSTPVSVSLDVVNNIDNAGGHFKAFIFDTLDNIYPLTKNLSTK